MRYSELFGKTLRRVSQETEAASHRFLIRGGFIDQLAAGIYSFLPLGWQVHRKIENIIRQEMDVIDGQEVFLPTLQPKSLWQKTGRWDNMDPPLFKLKDQHKRDYALGSTHEEVITDLVRSRVNSYRDLPFYLYQIQNKFRNEIRATGGLLRVREFIMKDLYSFHVDQKDLAAYFKKVMAAYKKIFSRCGLKTVVCQASGGAIGGSETYEFHVLSPVGEDKIFCCSKCDWGANVELVKNKKKCPECGAELKTSSAIEAGHVFALGTKYSKAMGVEFVDRDGQQKPVWMGCYGIGLGRLMAAIVEVHHDDKGIFWPKSVTPFQAHLVAVGAGSAMAKFADKVYSELLKAGAEILYDDREGVSVGVKFADADLIGIPVRLVVSEKTLHPPAGGSGQAGDKIEWKKRGDEKTELLTLKQVGERLFRGI